MTTLLDLLKTKTKEINQDEDVIIGYLNQEIMNHIFNAKQNYDMILTRNEFVLVKKESDGKYKYYYINYDVSKDDKSVDLNKTKLFESENPPENIINLKQYSVNLEFSWKRSDWGGKNTIKFDNEDILIYEDIYNDVADKDFSYTEAVVKDIYKVRGFLSYMFKYFLNFVLFNSKNISLPILMFKHTDEDGLKGRLFLTSKELQNFFNNFAKLNMYKVKKALLNDTMHVYLSLDEMLGKIPVEKEIIINPTYRGSEKFYKKEMQLIFRILKGISPEFNKYDTLVGFKKVLENILIDYNAFKILILQDPNNKVNKISFIYNSKYYDKKKKNRTSSGGIMEIHYDNNGEISNVHFSRKSLDIYGKDFVNFIKAVYSERKKSKDFNVAVLNALMKTFISVNIIKDFKILAGSSLDTSGAFSSLLNILRDINVIDKTYISDLSMKALKQFSSKLISGDFLVKDFTDMLNRICE